ncbi:Carboxylate-amine ligase YbdK [Legionella massiliensis]|uniref:Putative glutamate--cysteine ligase 2 n=1 Tax=Legionella massiliensis TaxID=1034943 RepID=A0A078L501_9GAMM|nr:YbdK family carboxylate-amine ligase [Legionella massiliensis]CDZ79149.1 Carboxylate-amine ligase YbdK [Legionella massiliensis]CEE14887.1 Carboxylate-amine ligase YbdK [Legionella massiliensis]
MKILPFKPSSTLSFGVELELQIIDPHSFGLTSRAKDLIRSIKESAYSKQIKPEITQSMIEINSSIHYSASDLRDELDTLRMVLQRLADNFDLHFCGGGTHPFQKWSMQKIFPTRRYKNLSRHYRYLSKRSTVFGQHVHIGCSSAEDAIYLTHAFTRYVPQFITICASSPFYQGVDTHYHSSRSTVFNSFPLSGVIPFVINWQEFSNYFYTMKNLGIIETMKDFYWDIRPKPEYGTVEVRVCDTPLTTKKATVIAAYIQALASYLLEERPIELSKELYYVYSYNRFQASRYGYEGTIINPYTAEKLLIADDILETIKKVERYANDLNSMSYILQIAQDAQHKHNDSTALRQILKQYNSFPKVVAEQCRIWTNSSL